MALVEAQECYASSKGQSIHNIPHVRAASHYVNGREDKGYQQVDWSRVKVCPLGLHNRSKQPKDNSFQNAYMAILFVSFGTNSLAGG
jgi:hypothetical protein